MRRSEGGATFSQARVVDVFRVEPPTAGAGALTGDPHVQALTVVDQETKGGWK